MRTLIGKPPNHWLHSRDPPTFDLTRPAGPEYVAPSEGSCVRVRTTTKDILMSPNRTALVIIDMQNYFLSPALGRDPHGSGNKAQEVLLNVTIPAARKAGIQIIWLNWGLDDGEVDAMPPCLRKGFGLEAILDRKAEIQQIAAFDSDGVSNTAADHKQHFSGDSFRDTTTEELTGHGITFRGLGSKIGPVKLADGSIVEGGRLLFTHTWNANLTSELLKSYESGLKASPPDVWIHKNRLSGLWGASTPCTEFLNRHEITTLMFAGVNTDQCVGGSLQDAFTKGFDCILVKDACGTTSPEYATKCYEFNAAKSYGFVIESSELLRGVDKMLDVRG